MRNIILLLLIHLSISAYSANTAEVGKTILTGKITDKTTGEPIPGATLYIPDLKTGTISAADGTYKIANLPQTKIVLQVSFTGYKMILETIDLSEITVKDFALELSAKEINEVVITGSSQSGERNRLQLLLLPKHNYYRVHQPISLMQLPNNPEFHK